MSSNSQAETVLLPPQVAIPPDPAARLVLISLNPRAGSRSCHERVEAISDALLQAGFQVRSTSDLKELAGLAEEGLTSGELRAVLAIGGDGTASIVRRHVPLAVPMLPVPMGTENLLGRYVEQAIDPASVCRTLKEGVVVGLDLGSAGGQHFLLMISAGFDAEVVRSLHENRRGNITRAAYVWPTLQTIRSYAYPQMAVSWSEPTDAPAQPPGRWLFGFNLPLYAFGLPIAPDAIATDGLLDVCMFHRGSMWDIVRYLWHVRRGGHHELPDTSMFRSHKFRLDGPTSHPVAYQIDGDYGGTLPVDIEVLPGELRLLVSREAARKLGFALA